MTELTPQLAELLTDALVIPFLMLVVAVVLGGLEWIAKHLGDQDSQR